MSRRLTLAAFALPALLLLLPSCSVAAPRDQLFESWQKFLALKSFRATITPEGQARAATLVLPAPAPVVALARSFRIWPAASLPGAPITQPPGWVPDPHW